jgi:heptaprenyl diphosphate synthase
MDEATLRRRTGELALGQLGGDPRGLLVARASDLLADLGAKRSGSRRGRSSGWSPVRSGDGRTRSGEDALEHYLTVVATDRFADLDLRAVRRCCPARRSPPSTAHPVRGADQSRSSWPTTCWTWPATPTTWARRPAPTCEDSDAAGAAHARRRRPGRCPVAGAAGGRVKDDAEHAEALALLRSNRDGAGQADARRWADDARVVLAPLPDIPARRALPRCATWPCRGPADRAL